EELCEIISGWQNNEKILAELNDSKIALENLKEPYVDIHGGAKARRSQMSLDTLRQLAEQLNLDTSGNKTDLVERITLSCASTMPQQSLPPSLSKSVYEEDLGNDTLTAGYFYSENQQQNPNRTNVALEDQSGSKNERNFKRKRGTSFTESSSDQTDEALDYIESAKKRARDRLTTLKVVKKYGWDVAVELPLAKDNDFVEHSDAIERARQIAASKKKDKINNLTESRPFFHSIRHVESPWYKIKEHGYNAGRYYNPAYTEPNKYNVQRLYYEPGHKNFSKPDYDKRTFNNEHNSKNIGKDFRCYNCGGLGHLAFSCPSSKNRRPFSQQGEPDNSRNNS
ncbi:1665_t:CDS:2, partial [Cetraspora pellucida]